LDKPVELEKPSETNGKKELKRMVVEIKD